MISTTDLDRPLPEGMFVEAAVGATVMCWLFIRAAAATEWRRILSFGERMPQEVSTDVSKTGDRAVSIWTSGATLSALDLDLSRLTAEALGLTSQPTSMEGIRCSLSNFCVSLESMEQKCGAVLCICVYIYVRMLV